MDAVLSRGACPYCGTASRPNALYCLDCGQIVTTAAPAAATPRAPLWIPPAPPEIRREAASAFVAPPMIDAVTTPEPPRRRRSGAVPAPPRVSLPEPDGALMLTFSFGQRSLIGGSAVIGRLPDDVARNSGRQAVTVTDDTRSVSRAHAYIDLGPEGAFVSDAGSANGTSLERGGDRHRLEGDPQELRDGDRVWFGDVWADVSLRAG